jgi:hypothetical protein
MYRKLYPRRKVVLRNVEDATPLSKKKQEVLFYFTIVGAITSTILALFSIYLTHKISLTSTKVDKMDSLLSLMTIQNQRQNDQLKELGSIQETAIEFSKKLSEQIVSTKDQTSFLQESYSPDISVGNIDFAKSNMKENQNVLSYEFTNTGGRILKNLNSRVLMFLPTIKVKDSIYYFDTFKPNIFNGNTTDLKPNSKNFHFITIPSHQVLDSIFKNCSLAIVADYVDPLTNKRNSKIFYYKNMKGLDNRLVSIYSTPKEARIMGHFIDTSSIFKRATKPVLNN